jgi:hypothetical protein
VLQSTLFAIMDSLFWGIIVGTGCLVMSYLQPLPTGQDGAVGEDEGAEAGGLVSYFFHTNKNLPHCSSRSEVFSLTVNQ